jgi:hypothetical protein
MIQFDLVYGNTPEVADIKCDFLQDGHIVTSFPAIIETISILLSPVNAGLYVGLFVNFRHSLSLVFYFD